MSDLVGKTLKDFYVLRRLGRGAMAEVYLAEQRSLARQVALKVLDGELARDPNYVRRFHHEARAAAKLVHGNIVQIYEVGEADGVHYIAQEYVAGRNLGEVIVSRGSLEPKLAIDILRQVAAALSKAASEGIVHRDIKPENIMLARTGEVKVADFGLARVQGDGGQNLTQVGVTMGTPLYMSPEQIEGRPLDSRSDIYSLGVTAYHMLAGEPPFHGDTPLAVAVQHLNQPAAPLPERVPELPPRLAGAVARMMAKKPEQRFRDPAELWAELVGLSEKEKGAEGEPGSGGDNAALGELVRTADDRAAVTTRLDEVMRTVAMTRPKRMPWRAAAVALVGCVVMGSAIAALIRPPSLLAGATSEPVGKLAPWAQLYRARQMDTEAGWLTTIKNLSGADSYYQNIAKQGLVYFYLGRSQEYDKAIKLLEELQGSPEPVYQAFSYAGLIVASVRLGEDGQAYDFNQKLTVDMRQHLRQQAPRMAGLLDGALNELAERPL